MKFAIRDDDTNYFTMPQDLLDNYSDIWDVCPISLSVVPFHACTRSGAIPEKYWSGDDIFPIADNEELAQFLKETITKGKVSITLHGYNHKDNADGYEFDTLGSPSQAFGKSLSKRGNTGASAPVARKKKKWEGSNLSDKVRRGKEYLESVFKTEITAFVPPHNAISKAGLMAVIRNGLNLVNIPSFRFGKRPLSVENLLRLAEIRRLRWKHRNSAYPYVLTFSDHKEVNYHSLTPMVSLDSLKNSFDFCHRMRGVFVLATHYWEFSVMQVYDSGLKMGDVFYQFWEYVRSFDDIEPVSVNQVFGERS